MNLEVLVVTMNQTDLGLLKKMNLKCNTLITNQCGKWDYIEEDKDDCKVRMLSSDTKGVGINRNIGLELAQGDVLVFSDDDITYYDSELKGIKEAFENLPQADAIFFNMDHSRGGKVYCNHSCKIGRLHLWNAMNYGTSRIAVKREALQKARISFSTLFGGGAKYSCGEDTLFIRDLFKAGLKVYSYDCKLGVCVMDDSSWFEGFNEKYLFDKGVLLACAFPKMKNIIKWYFALKFSKPAKLSLSKAVKVISDGIKAYKTLDEFNNEV